MDVLRTAAVVLVVMEHAVILPFSLTPGWLWATNAAATPYRIPTLMFLSGMLLSRSLAKPVGVYVRGKIERILWPFLVWTTVLLLVSLRWGEPEAGGWQPYVHAAGPMFYLQYLLAFYLLALVVPTAVRAISVIPLLVASALAVPESESGRALFLLAFFFAGDTLARHADRLMPFIQRRPVIVGCALVTVALSMAAALGLAVRYNAIAAGGTFAGVVTAIALCRILSDTRLGVVAGRYGPHTIIFYVTSWPAQIIVRDELVDAGFTNGVALVAILLAVGLAVGFIFVAAQARVPAMRYLFDLSRPGRC